MQTAGIYLQSIYQVSSIDYEWLEIIKRLKKYGVKSTGNKTADYTLLKKLERREAETDSCAPNLMNIPQPEQTKLKEGKKEAKTENTPENSLNQLENLDLLGSQIFAAVKMNNKIRHKKN